LLLFPGFPNIEWWSYFEGNWSLNRRWFFIIYMMIGLKVSTWDPFCGKPATVDANWCVLRVVEVGGYAGGELTTNKAT
jgi:hypothetical protein